MESTEEETRPREGIGEQIERIGCTALTVVVLLLLACSLVYFFTGLSAMIMRFIQTVQA